MRENPRPRRHRRATEAALALVLLGCTFLLPPGAGIFQIDGKIGGIPVALVALFAVWALLIVGNIFASSALTAPDRDQDFGP